MLSFQEMVDKAKTAKSLNKLKRHMNSGVFHPEECSIYNGLSPADTLAFKEAFSKYSLAEFLAKSGSTGIAGAAYLIPDKLHDTLIFYSQRTDWIPLISAYVATQWQGGDLKVDIVNDETFRPKQFSSGGTMATETVETMQATCTMKGFGMPLIAGVDLIEDANFDLVEYHTSKAAAAMGQHATQLALTVLVAASDGWGTLNTAATGNAAETKWMGATTTGISEAIDHNGDDGWFSNTILTTTEPWTHSISETLPAGSVFMPVKEGFHHCVNNMDILIDTYQRAGTYVGALINASSKLLTVVFDRFNSMLAARKRWMQVENYANPREDLSGAVVTCRQDSVSLYNDSVFVISET